MSINQESILPSGSESEEKKIDPTTLSPSLTKLFFSHLGSLDFKGCIDIINSIKDKSKEQTWLGLFTTCEHEYFQAKFGTGANGISLQERYSILSSRVKNLFLKEAPTEDSLRSSFFVDYEKEKGLIVSSNLWESIYQYLNIREKLCVFYESIAKSKAPHSYNYFSNLALNIKVSLKVKNQVKHRFMKENKRNIECELEILFELFNLNSCLDRLEYIESINSLWRVKVKFREWEKIHPEGLVDEVKMEEIQSKSMDKGVGSSSQKAKLLGAVMKKTRRAARTLRNFPKSKSSKNLKEKDSKFMKNNNPEMMKKKKKLSNISSYDDKEFQKQVNEMKERIPKRIASKLKGTSLYKFLRGMLSCSFHKCSFYFHDILVQHEESKIEFEKYIEGNSSIIKQVEIFCQANNIYSLFVLYNAKRKKYTVRLDPKTGYSLQKQMNLDDCLDTEFRGIKSHPCLYFYSPKRLLTKENLIIQHWPNILNLIWTDSVKLDKGFRPVSFNDKSKKISYFYIKTGVDIYVVIMKENSVSGKLEQVIGEFMIKLNNLLQNKKLFAFLRHKAPDEN